MAHNVEKPRGTPEGAPLEKVPHITITPEQQKQLTAVLETRVADHSPKTEKLLRVQMAANPAMGHAFIQKQLQELEARVTSNG